jgi:photosystem II stability/assembly factor-like uncharacterized protein
LAAYADRIFAGVESGIFCSKNNGRLWHEIAFPMELAPVNAILRVGSQLLAGSEESGLYCSLDDGQTWQRTAAEVFPAAVNDLWLSNSGLIMAVSDEDIQISVDQGASWQQRWRVKNGFGIAACAAGDHFTAASSLLVGLADGQIIRVD